MMIFRNFFSVFKLGAFLFVLVYASSLTVKSQQLGVELHSKLSVSDQKKIQKIELEYTKGKQTKLEAEKIAPNTLGKDANTDEKKYYKKRAEASDYMLNATNQKYDLYNDYIKNFWKTYKGEKRLLDFAKVVETAVADSFKKAKDNRTLVNKLKKVSNQVQLLEMAESTEARGIMMTQKVLYTYLNWPIEYNHTWLSLDNQEIPRIDTPKQMDTVSQTKVSTSKPVDAKPIDSTFIVKSGDTKSVETKPAGPKSVSFADAAYVNTDNVATAKEGPKTKSQPKQKEELVSNDSSLYGKVKVNEDKIDRFNKFLSQTYPADFEKYIVNFNALDYSDINSIRKAWNVYQGLESPDSSMIASNQVIYLIKNGARPPVNDQTAGTSDQLASNQFIKKDSVRLAETATGKKTLTVGKIKPSAKTDTVKFGLVKTPVKSDYIKVIPEKTKSVKSTSSSRKTALASKSTTSAESSTSTELSQIADAPVTNGFLFRVQIGACKTSVSTEVLKSIYNGSENIRSTNEDGWYKYIVGEFTTYQEARKFRNELRVKIPGAFVVAYLSGKRIKITPAVVSKRK